MRFPAGNWREPGSTPPVVRANLVNEGLLHLGRHWALHHHVLPLQVAPAVHLHHSPNPGWLARTLHWTSAKPQTCQETQGSISPKCFPGESWGALAKQWYNGDQFLTTKHPPTAPNVLKLKNFPRSVCEMTSRMTLLLALKKDQHLSV